MALAYPFTASAENGGEIRNCIVSINRLYESLDYEFALNQVQLGHQLPRSTDEEVMLSLYEGIILSELRKPGSGSSAFRAALLLRPEAKLPVRVAPKVEELFESVRKQVKQEVRTLPRRPGTENPNRAEQKRAVPTAPPATGPAQVKREPTDRSECKPEVLADGQRLLTQLPYLKGRLLRTSSPSNSSSLEDLSKIGQKFEAACTREELQQAAQALGSWQHRHGLMGSPPQPPPNTRETSKQEEGAAKAQTDTSKCQAAVRNDCQRLLNQLFYLQEQFLRTDSLSKLGPLRELSTIGQQLRAARTIEELKEAARVLGLWQRRQLPYNQRIPE